MTRLGPRWRALKSSIPRLEKSSFLVSRLVTIYGNNHEAQCWQSSIMFLKVLVLISWLWLWCLHQLRSRQMGMIIPILQMWKMSPVRAKWLLHYIWVSEGTGIHRKKTIKQKPQQPLTVSFSYLSACSAFKLLLSFIWGSGEQGQERDLKADLFTKGICSVPCSPDLQSPVWPPTSHFISTSAIKWE